MFSHIMVGTNDLDRAQTFYDGVLAVLGAPKGVRITTATGQQRVFYSHNGTRFGITQPINGQPATVANGSTIGFSCESVEQAQQFYDTALALGATAIEDPPGIRQTSIGPAYLAYLRDLDGHKICVFGKVE